MQLIKYICYISLVCFFLLCASSVNSQILVIAEDISNTGWQTYRDALTNAGQSWDEWNLDSLSFPSAGDLSPYSIIILADEDSLLYDDAECQIISDWLVSGNKKIFATSVDYLWDLQNGYEDQGEHNLYLLMGAHYEGDYAGTGIAVLNGTVSDPIGNGLTLKLSQNGDSNGDYINSASSSATIGLTYGAGGGGSGFGALTHYSPGTYQAVVLSVNFHNGLTDQEQRNKLMLRILEYFGLRTVKSMPWLNLMLLKD